MSVQEFKRDTISASNTGGIMKERQSSGQNSDTKVNNSRPPSGMKKTNIVKDKVDMKSAEERCENSKLLREKQIEERKKKNAERKAAVEDRRKQKEREDNAKSEALKHLLEHKAPSGSKTTGRKLPTVPREGSASNPRRESSGMRKLSSSSSSSESTGHTPPGLGKNSGTTRRNLTGPTSASTSSLNSFGSSQHVGKPSSNLGTSKKASVSTNSLNDKTLKDKPGQRVKEKGAGTSSRRSAGSALPKAQSMGAIHQVGQSGTRPSGSRPPSGKKAKPKPKPTHHAGSSTEQEAKQALAEHRKRIREEAERKALLDKEKQEELRRQREEEEKRLAEENAKEMARQAKLTEQLQEQEAERAQLLREQREKEAEIEAERMAVEIKRKEELEVLKKQEMEKRAKEAEKREKEEEERLMKEELERQERRKESLHTGRQDRSRQDMRVEMIMSRTRMTSTVNNNMIKAESYSSLEDLSVKLSDECHSSTVSEILQKVKEKSRTSPSPEKDTDLQKENQQFLETSGKDAVDGKNENSNDVLREIDNSSKLESLISQSNRKCLNNSNSPSLSLREHGNDVDDQNLSGGECAGGTLRDIGCTLRDNCGTSRDKDWTSRDSYGTLMGTDGTSRNNGGNSRVNDGSQSTLRDTDTHSTPKDTPRGTLHGSPRGGTKLAGDDEGHEGTKQDAELWKNVEHCMIAAENDVRDNLERNGAIADDEDDEDGEEGQLWKVVEGRREISEII